MFDRLRKVKLHWWILLGMAAGALLGTLFYLGYTRESIKAAEIAVLGEDFLERDAAERRKLVLDHAREIEDELTSRLESNQIYLALDGVAQVFLRLLKMIVIPLVFFSLVSGMMGMGDIARLGRIGLKTFALYILTSLLATLTGLGLVNVIRPGDPERISISVPARAAEFEPPGTFWEVLIDMVPENVVAAAARFDLLGVIVFTLFFGVFLLATDAAKRTSMVGFIEGGADVMMKMTRFIISLAPVGILALIARMVSRTGPGVFLDMVWYVATVLSGLAIHALVTLPLLIYILTRRNPYRFFHAMSTAYMTGFSTASSSGTLAITMERAEKGAGISNRVASFVLPLGATINMDGTALYEIVSVLFIAQIHAAVDPAFQLSIGQQALIVFLGLTVSVGAAGIPHAGLVMMVIILQAVGLPVAYTGIIWTVDRVLDMLRTATNIVSDSSITLVIAHGEKEIDEGVFGGRAAPEG